MRWLRGLSSVLIAWHLVAIGLAALPPPEELTREAARLEASPNRSSVQVALDAVLGAALPPLRAVADLAQFLKPVVSRYHGITGTRQAWSMFGDPSRSDRYMRVRYYIRPRAGRLWAATELVWPAHREDRVRLLRSFQNSFRDKAIDIAYDSFLAHRRSELIHPATRWGELPDDLAPVARYFARRFARTKALAASGDAIVRTEVWVGRAPIQAPGRAVDRATQAERVAALQAYYEGPVEHRLSVPPVPPYRGSEREADIQWVLEYFEEP